MESVNSAQSEEQHFKDTVRIPAQLYFDLYEKGGRNADRLIACYALLRSVDDHKNYFHAYKGKNGVTVKGYQMLSKKSGLSRATLEKYVPAMIELKIARFDEDGNFFLTGSRRLNRNFRNRKTNTLKLVPIHVVKQNIILTSHSVMMVRIASSERQQRQQIALKEERQVLLSKFSDMSKGVPNVHLSKKDWKKANKIYDKVKVKEIPVEKEIVLSLNGYSRLRGHENPNSNKGHYWKKKLKKNKWIKSKRRFNLLTESYYPKELFDMGKAQGIFSPSVFWRDGMIYQEVVSTLCVSNLFKPLKKQNPSVNENSVSQLNKKNNSDFSCLIKSNDLTSRTHTCAHAPTHAHDTHTHIYAGAQNHFGQVVCNSFPLPNYNPFTQN